jgi:sugar-specific transcriptional regulator TrmB
MELSNRNCLQNLYDLGFTEAKQLKVITNIPQRTVYRVLNRTKAGDDMKRRPGDGRPSKYMKYVHQKFLEYIRISSNSYLKKKLSYAFLVLYELFFEKFVDLSAN